MTDNRFDKTKVVHNALQEKAADALDAVADNVTVSLDERLRSLDRLRIHIIGRINELERGL